MKIVPGEPLRRGELNNRRVAEYSDFGPIERYIRKRCKIGAKLVLITNSRI